MAYKIHDEHYWGVTDYSCTGITYTSDGIYTQSTESILDSLDIEDIENYLRKKKIDRIKKGIN